MKKIIIIITLLLTACTNYHELNNLGVISTIYIKKNKVEVLINKNEIIKAKGKTISEAFDNIQRKTNKKLYFGHVNLIIIDENTAKKGIYKITDYILRNPESKDSAIIITSKNNKKLNILNQIKENNEDIYFTNFLEKSLKYGIDPYTSTIKNDSLTNLSLYKKDKYIIEASKIDSVMIKLINEKKELNYNIDNINYRSNNIKVKYKIKNNNIKIYIKTKGFVSEIYNKKIESQKNKEDLEKQINKKMKKDIKNLINNMKYKYKLDPLGLENKIYQNSKKKVKLQKINVEIKTNNKIISTGSIDRSFE